MIELAYLYHSHPLNNYIIADMNPGKALSKLRNKKLSPERRSEIARIAVKARWAKTTPEERSAYARKIRTKPYGKNTGKPQKSD